MARPLNRPAILLNLAAFVGVIVFCVSIDAPIIQQDILKRCQDTLLMRRVAIGGLSIDGRDVTLSGSPDSAILSPRIQTAMEQVNGVRIVNTRVLSVNQSSDPDVSSMGNLEAVHESAQDVQAKIDRILENQVISFKTDTSALTPESELALNKIATYLAHAPGLLCEIRGRDSQTAGDSQTNGGSQNWVLALQRALSTEDYLENKGIADWRLSTRAFHAGEGAQGRGSRRAIDLVVRAKEQ